MAKHWKKPLAQPIKLKKRRAGVVLETLLDAANFMLGEYGSVTHSIAIRDAVEELMHAAETGKKPDIDQATDLIWRVLKHSELV